MDSSGDSHPVVALASSGPMIAQGKPVQYDELLVTVFICVIGGLLLIVGLGIYFENELTSLFFGGEASSAAKPAGAAGDANGRRASVPAADPSGAGGGGAADPSASGGGAGFGCWGSPKRPGDRRVYSNGVRLEELLQWPAMDACRALHAYALEMSGEDTEAFFAALPQITNCVLGLDHANGALNKGWLNQQARTLCLPYTYIRTLPLTPPPSCSRCLLYLPWLGIAPARAAAQPEARAAAAGGALRPSQRAARRRRRRRLYRRFPPLAPRARRPDAKAGAARLALRPPRGRSPGCRRRDALHLHREQSAEARARRPRAGAPQP
jgi:hypothetical protein